MQVQPKQRPSVSGKSRVLRIPGGKTKKHLNIGTWNIRSLYEAGKLKNTILEMNRLNIDILGISETWWPDCGEFKSENTTIFYSGNQNTNHRNGVGIIVKEQVAKCVIGFIPKSDRTLLIKINAKPLIINIIQVYAPTADKNEEEIENFYAEIDELMKLTKSHEINIIQGDFNAKIGEGYVDGIVGNFGLGERNERGDRLVQFCQDHNMKITNTWFHLPARRLYTWKSPQDSYQNIVRNQIDFILINKRFGSSVNKVSTYPGADVPSDHNLLLAKISAKLSVIKKKPKQQKLDLTKLKEDENTKSVLTTKINDELLSIRLNANTEDAERLWERLKTLLNTHSLNHLGKKRYEIKNKWITNEIITLMQERRTYKNKNQSRYRELNYEIRRKIRDAKIDWMNSQCEEIERLQKLHDDFNLHKKLKETAGIHRKTMSNFLLDDNNEVVLDLCEKKKVWQEYIYSLFSDTSRSAYQAAPIENLSGPVITKDEIKDAIKRSKDNKATGPDELPSEILKLINDENIEILEIIFNYIYDTGKYPQDWLRSTFIALPKKKCAKKCCDHRLISLMSHSLKIFLKIIHKRIYKKCESAMGETQFGFKEGMGTREALFCIQVLVENCRDVQKDVFMCFIDYEKAFDTVQHDKLIEILQNMDIDTKEIQCIRNLYWQQTAEVNINNETTDAIPILRGVRQGCILSPLLFNIYSERIFQEALQGLETGIKVNGTNINNIRYADDTTLLSDSLSGLQELVNVVTRCSKNFGLKININKTKYMIVSRKNTYVDTSLTINDMLIERVKNFKYLGCWINENWNSSKEIKARIEISRAAFHKYKKVLNNHDFNIKLKIRFVKCYVLSVLLYAMEIGTIKTTEMNKIEAFEMWIYRRILRIPWTDRVTNAEVLRRIQHDRQLLTTIKRRKAAYLGHIMRNDKYHVLQLILQGKIEGKRGIGRKQLSWLRNIRHWTGIGKVGTLLETARNRDLYHEIITNLY